MIATSCNLLFLQVANEMFRWLICYLLLLISKSDCGSALFRSKCNYTSTLRWLILSHLIWIYAVFRFNFLHFWGLKYKPFYKNELVLLPLFQGVNISTCVSGRGQLIIGDYEGMIFYLGRQFQLFSFNAYQIRVSHLFMMKQSNLLISIGVSTKFIRL